jgi:hypothetical protein
MEQITTTTRPNDLLMVVADGSLYQPTGELLDGDFVAIPVDVNHSYDPAADIDTYTVIPTGAAVVLPDNDGVITY